MERVKHINTMIPYTLWRDVKVKCIKEGLLTPDGISKALEEWVSKPVSTESRSRLK